VHRVHLLNNAEAESWNLYKAVLQLATLLSELGGGGAPTEFAGGGFSQASTNKVPQWSGHRS
jgi:hypothetical protein